MDTHDHVIYHDTVAPVQHGLTSNVNAVSSMPVTTRGSVVRREQCNRKPMRTRATDRARRNKHHKTNGVNTCENLRDWPCGGCRGSADRAPPTAVVRTVVAWTATAGRKRGKARAPDKTRPHAQYCCIREFQFGLPTQKRDFLSAGERVHAPGSSRRGGLRVNRVLLDEDILPRRLRPFARP